MSYSRWGGSYWYTFWACARDGVIENRDNATFEICAVCHFSAKELREDIGACLARAKEEEARPGATFRHGLATDEDIQELRGLMTAFLADVDVKYPAEVAAT